MRRSVRVRGTRLVRASVLPDVFRIPSTFHAAGPAFARRIGSTVAITFLGHTVYLRPSDRVRVVRGAA